MNLTIGITSYNREDFIAQSIESALDVTPDVILVDDASTDATLDIASLYPIQIIKHERNSGSAVDGWQEIIACADGDWLCLLGSDDKVTPDFWRVMQQYTDGHDWLFCDLRMIDGNGTAVGLWQYDGWSTVPQEAIFNARLSRSMPMPWQGCHRVGFLREHGLTACRWAHTDFASDVRTALEWLKHEPRCLHVAHPLIEYRLHGGSETNMKAHEREMFVSDLLDYFKEE